MLVNEEWLDFGGICNDNELPSAPSINNPKSCCRNCFVKYNLTPESSTLPVSSCGLS